jgi:hypothetical protein
MIKTWTLILGLIASPALAETFTVDPQSSQQFANELQFCSIYLREVSQCYTDKNFTSRVSPQVKKLASEIAPRYGEQATLASNNAIKAWKTSGVMSSADFAKHFAASLMALNDEIGGDCANINILIKKYGEICKRRIDKPLQRLKELSECSHKEKAKC